MTGTHDLVQLFLAGFTAAFGPCLLTCSPVVLPFVTATRTNARQSTLDAVVFSLARLLTFIQLGMLVAVLGNSLTSWLARWHHVIGIVAGSIIALLGLLLLLGRDLQSDLCRRIHGRTTKGFTGMLLLGVMMGLMPCGAKLGVLTYIAVQGHTIWRGLTMSLAFGLGEVWSPIILLVALSGFLPRVLASPRAQAILSRISGFFVLLIGIRLILFPN